MRTISRAGLRQHFPTTSEIGCSEPMHLKELGKTGVQIPEIGLGTWQYRGGVEPIRKAIFLGSSLVDTAESYCTEEIVGEAVNQLRNRVFIATKVSPRHFPRADVLI